MLNVKSMLCIHHSYISICHWWQLKNIRTCIRYSKDMFSYINVQKKVFLEMSIMHTQRSTHRIIRFFIYCKVIFSWLMCGDYCGILYASSGLTTMYVLKNTTYVCAIHQLQSILKSVFVSGLSPFAFASFNSLRPCDARFCIIRTGVTIIPHSAPMVSHSHADTSSMHKQCGSLSVSDQVQNRMFLNWFFFSKHTRKQRFLQLHMHLMKLQLHLN